MPRKTFTAGEVLAAADVNEYLMDQSVMTFADSGARGSAIGTAIAQEGMLTYLEDTDAYEYWSGTAFEPLAAGIRNPVDETNTAAGTDALNPSTTGAANTAFGNDALAANTTGTANVAVGAFALDANTTGNENLAIGVNAAGANTTGLANIVIGKDALAANTAGNSNVAIGGNTLLATTTGLNVGVGRAVLRSQTTGTENVGVGSFVFDALTTGVNNTAIGNSANTSSTTGSNNMVLGYNAQPSTTTVSNQITLGSGSITSLRCQVTTISSLSDARDKKDIVETKFGLAVINKLRPVDFTWNRRDGELANLSDIGFIAQELAEVEDSLGATERLKLTLRDNPEKLEATPGRLIPVMVKAIQELSAQNAELVARLEKLENK